MSNIIETTSLSHYFNKNLVISDLTIAIESHSITGVIGRNGAGKTTLLKIFAGLLQQTSGDLQVLGATPLDNITCANQIIYSYHNIEYSPSLKLSAILTNYHDMFPNFDLSFAKELLRYFQLNEKAKYKNLSQGMASVFNFLCALSCRSPITILDEPVLGMDITIRKDVYEILLRDYIEHPRTILISSHLLSELENVLSDILLIEQGKLVLQMPLEEMRNRAHRVDGESPLLDQYCKDKKVLERQQGPLKNYAIIYESLDDTMSQQADELGLSITQVSTEDLCVYLTKPNKEDHLECLWKKNNNEI